MNIEDVQAIEVLDSRGNPTIKAYVMLDNDAVGTAIVPSGASTGSHEAHELRDGDKRYHGKGVSKAVENVNTTIASELKGISADDLEAVDNKMIELDGTSQKSKLGANAILAVSLATARALAVAKNQTPWQLINEHYFSKTAPNFPRPMVNVINGGAHANWTLDIQEFMILPVSKTPTESIRAASEIFHSLKKILKSGGYAVSVGDEGGFAPELGSNDEAFQKINEAIKAAGYSRDNIDLATDVAASEFYKGGKYVLKREDAPPAGWSNKELADFYKKLIAKYNVLSFEDPFAEDDWGAFSDFTKETGDSRMIVGDDIFVTNTERIQKGINTKAANALLVKVNQIGSLSETVNAINMARDAGWKIVISHRSGETEDPFIADLAYACAAEFIKTGSMSRSDRLAKYNRLLEIELMEA